MQASQAIFDPPAFEALLAADRRRLVCENAPLAFRFFFPVVTLIGAAEWVTRPGHRPALIVVGLAYAVIATVGLALLRLRPQWALSIAVGGCNALCIAMLSYSPMVKGSGELCVLAINVLMGGFAVAFPLGRRRLLIASIVPLVGYAVILQLGTTTAYPVWYSVAALLSFLTVLVAGAQSIDQYHRHALRTAMEQAALAEENARLRDEAYAADRAKTDLLSILSHELRTPLFGIRMMSEVLARSELGGTAEWREHIQRIDRQAKQSGDLVQAMLEFGTIETGALRVSMEEIDTGALFEQLRDELATARIHPGVEVRWNADTAGVSMQTDRGKLESIVRNLLHNALRHTLAGSVELKATTDVARDLVVISVHDTGEGITRETLPVIFERFARGTDGGEGFGLGLYIVKRFVAALGGEIAVESTPGIGTRFTVQLPRVLPPAT